MVGFGPFESRTTSAGRFYNDMLFNDFGRPAGCQSTQLRVFSTDAATVADVLGTLTRQPFENGVPMVVGDEAAASVPEVIPCPGTPPGEPAKTGGPGSGNAYASPEDALQAFLEEQTTLIPFGYRAFRLPDESIAYATRQPGGKGFVTVVHVVRAGLNWTVESWEAPSC
jgi:hypothetical protein